MSCAARVLICALAGVAAVAAQAQTIEPAPKVRLIAPELIAPLEAGELERLPALEAPPAPEAKRRKVVPPTARLRLLPLPIAEAAGVFTADGYRVALAGLGPANSEEVCGEDAKWNCGAAARTAFRAFLRGRSVRCRVPDERPGGQETIVTQCSVGGEDMGAWLIANGWARRSGDAYAAEEHDAVQRRLGVYGPPPSRYAPSFSSISAQVSGTP